MSRIITDRDLRSWEVYPSSGPFGMPERPAIVFNCLSEPDLPARFVMVEGDAADAGAALEEASEERLLEMLEASRELP